MRFSSLGGLVEAVVLLASCTQASTLTPPILPLFVRTPYFNSWLANARDVPWSHWPIFWTGEQIGMAIMASTKDNKNVYPLLGRVQDFLEDGTGIGDGYNVSFPTYKGANYDASTTNLTYHIPSPDSRLRPLELTLSFLSPITPTSTLRQSLPAAYLTVYVSGSFDIDIYIDVNGQWVSGDQKAVVEWDLLENGDKGSKHLKTWKVHRQSELLYTEINDRSEWGHLLFSASSDVRHESGTAKTLRRRFSRTGTLQNQIDQNFRGVMDKEPVFAFSKSFNLSGTAGTTSTKHDSVRFTLAHVQDPIVQFASARGLLHSRPLWKSWLSTDEKLIDYHYLDFHNAQALAQNYSDQLAIDAYQSGSSEYVDIVALSARQVLGATSFGGTPDSPLLFLKEISSNGNAQTVDVIFPSFPFFLYTNPRWLSYLLEPLIEHQLSGQYPNDYSMHDIGAHFPNETGHADGRDEYMPVEECGDMLIMGLALVNSLLHSGASDAQSIWSTVGSQQFDDESDSPFSLTSLGSVNGIDFIDDTWGGGAKGIKQSQKWLKKSYRLWKQWTVYLVEYSLEPANQLSTDDFAGWLPLQTNLALKGIIGIKAMGELSALVGEDADAEYYKNVSSTYITKWEEFAMSRDGTHAKLAYDWYGSWTVLYSLYADAVLCFHPTLTGSTDSVSLVRPGDQKPIGDKPKPISKDFIPNSIYKKQSKWYANVIQKYGVPLDSRHLYTKSDWQFEAAAVASPSVRKEILHRVSKWLNETVTNRPFADLYNTEGNGDFPGPFFFARPVVGGHFAFLTLERSCGGTAGKASRVPMEDEELLAMEREEL